MAYAGKCDKEESHHLPNIEQLTVNKLTSNCGIEPAGLYAQYSNENNCFSIVAIISFFKNKYLFICIDSYEEYGKK